MKFCQNNDDLFFILGKFESIFIDDRFKLTNVNQVLVDFKVIYEILTKDYSRFKLKLWISTNSPRFIFSSWNSIYFFEDI
jgi:hypothetical protein